MSNSTTEQEMYPAAKGSSVPLLPASARKAPLGLNSEAIVAAIECLWGKRRTLLISFTAITVLCLVLIFFVMKPRYQGEVLLVPPNSASSAGLPALSALTGMASGGGAAGAGGLMSSLLGGQMSSDLLSDALGSDYIEDRIVERFHLTSVYNMRHDRARMKLDSKTKVDVSSKSSVVTLDVTDPDPKRAAAMANAYAEELDHLLVKMNTESAKQQRVYYEERVTQAKQDLLNASDELSKFSSANRTLNVDDQDKAIVDAAAAIQGQIIAAQSDLKAAEKLYTAQNPQVIQARARVEELQSQLSKLSVGQAGSLHGKHLGGPEDQLFPSITQLPALGVKYLDLYREVKVREAVYELVVQQYYVAKLQELQAMAGVQVVSPATVPEREKPFRYVVGAVLWVLLNLCVVAFVLLREVWRNMNLDDPRKKFLYQVAQVLKAR